MKGKDLKIFLEAVEVLEKEKGISKESLLETIEQALLAAYKKNYEEDGNVEVSIDRDSGDIKVYSTKEIIEEVLDPALEISLEDAYKINKDAQLGDFIKVEEKCEDFKRNAIQNGKQIVIQKVREAERNSVYERFKEKEFNIINGIIRRIDERKNIHIEFDKTEAILPIAEQSVSDVYRIGERIKVYVVEVEKRSKFPKIVISRKHEDFLRELFKLEIPEIEDGIIEIKSVSREAGSRAKVAVYSTQEGIDTIGACIGQKRQRINTIVEELNGEKIDIIEWKEDKVAFVSAALSPAKVKSVDILEDGVTARVVVEPSQLSLAIGKNGQNARLAAKLTGMRIDIKTDEEETFQEEGIDE
jgi:N utilization substance protein A